MEEIQRPDSSQKDLYRGKEYLEKLKAKLDKIVILYRSSAYEHD
jgi:hypothetical protein